MCYVIKTGIYIYIPASRRRTSFTFNATCSKGKVDVQQPARHHTSAWRRHIHIAAAGCTVELSETPSFTYAMILCRFAYNGFGGCSSMIDVCSLLFTGAARWRDRFRELKTYFPLCGHHFPQNKQWQQVLVGDSGIFHTAVQQRCWDIAFHAGSQSQRVVYPSSSFGVWIRTSHAVRDKFQWIQLKRSLKSPDSCKSVELHLFFACANRYHRRGKRNS